MLETVLKIQTGYEVLALQHFFGVTSLKAIPGLRRYQTALRTGKRVTKGGSPEAIASWLRVGERAAAQIHCAPIKPIMLEKTVGSIRKMTCQAPEQFQEPLHKILASSGVALVLCPHMPSTGIHGATFWMGSDKAVVMMTIRYKWADIFWFSRFHELGHVLLHGRNAVVLEGENGDVQAKKRENRADSF